MDLNFSLEVTSASSMTPNTVSDNWVPDDVRRLAQSYLMSKIGYYLAYYYLPVFAPLGFIGNILSLLIMMQRHNRQMSFSLYISALAISDTTALLMGCRYLLVFIHLKSPPPKFWYCDIWIVIVWVSSLCSTLFILNMTFERFYSIIRPHKAASFNTVKRAKITIVVIVCVSTIFNIPHLFITLKNDVSCIPFGRAEHVLVKIYYWLTLTLNFFLPFVLLLIMNCVIIRTLQQRSGIQKHQGQGQNEGQTSKMKNTEKQIFITLLLVTFGFLILNAPVYSFFVYVQLYDFHKSARAYAGYNLFIEVSSKAYYTNYGINFFFYVMSGQKFRSDLVRLVTCGKSKPVDSTQIRTVSFGM